MAPSTSTKKSQVWSLDLIIAMVIFFGTLLIFYKYSINSVYAEQKDIDNMVLDAKIISSYLISPGYPEDWHYHPVDVTLIGLTNGNMDINPNKVEEFFQLSLSNYTKTRKILSTTHDYYIFFEDKNNNSIEIREVDWIGKDYTTENPDNIIKIFRFLTYNSTIIRLGLYIW